MTSFTKTALAALMTGAIALTAVPGSAIAQDRPGAPEARQHGQQQQQFRNHGKFQGQHGPQGKFGGDMRNQGGPRGGGLIDLVCSERGAEQLEIAFVRLAHRLDLTAEQTPLFDDLKATALTAQTQFADQCASALPARDQAAATPAERPDMVTRLKTRLDIDKARITAMETVLPKLEALFASLSDTQKHSLAPRQHRNGPGAPMPPAQPGNPAPSEAPAGAPDAGSEG